MKKFVAWILNKNEFDQNINKNLPLTCTINGIKKSEIPISLLLEQKTVIFYDNYVAFDDDDKIEFFLDDKELPKWIYPIIKELKR